MRQDENSGVRLLTVAQAAKLCGFAEVTIRAWVARRKISYCRLGGRAIRIPVAEIDRLIERDLMPARDA